MASSICEQTHSSGGSDQEVVQHASAAHHFSTATAAVAAAAAPQQEESLYETMLRYQQEHGSDCPEDLLRDEHDDDDQSEESYRAARLRRARQRNPQHTSGLSSTPKDPYNPPLNNTAVDDDDDRKIPARQVSEDRKPAARPTGGFTSIPTSSGSSRNSERTYRPVTGRRKKPPPVQSHSETTRSANIDHATMRTRQADLSSLSNNTNRNSTPSSFYQAALREATSMEGLPEKKPGIVQVNEPAMRSNSAMFLDAYCDDQSAATNSNVSRPPPGVAPGVAVPTKGPPPLHPEELQSIHANLSRSRSGDSSRGNTPTRSRPPKSLPSPMGRDQVREQLAALKQNRAPSPTRPARPDPVIPPSMGRDEVQKALDALKTKPKQPPSGFSRASVNTSLAPSSGSPEEEYRGHGRTTGRGSRPHSPSPSQTISSMHGVSSQERSLYEAGYDGGNGSRYTRTTGRLHPQQDHQQPHARASSPVRNLVQHPAQRNVRAASPVRNALPKAPPAARRSSGAVLDPSELMDIGSDEHMQRAREMERRKSDDLKGMRSSLNKASVSRGASPARSVNTTMSSPNPSIHVLLPGLRRDSTYDSQSHSSRSSIGPMPAATVKPAPGQEPLATSSRSGDAGYMRRSHNTPPRSRVSGNHARPPAAYPQGLSHNHNITAHQHYDQHHVATGALLTHHSEQARSYPTVAGHERERQYRQSSNGSQPAVTRSHPPYRNASNPNIEVGRTEFASPTNLVRRRSNSVDGESTHSGSRASNNSTTNDEEFKLALELSLKEAEANSLQDNQVANEAGWNDYVAQSRAAPRVGRSSNSALERPARMNDVQRSSTSGNVVRRPPAILSGNRSSTAPYSSSRRDSTPSSLAQDVPPTPFAQDAYQAANDSGHSDADEELLLALRISAQETRAQHELPLSNAAKPKETLNPEEQLRILQRIREEKERKELEMALKASEAESANAAQASPMGRIRPSPRNTIPAESSSSFHAPTMNAAPSASSGSDPGDFLTSQQRAMEEYQQSRGPTTTGQSRGRTKEPPPPASEEAEELLLKGAMETQQAISSGRAHIVKCKKCGARLQAPVSYSLVYCPQCQTVSPA
ncbi:MAG: hypothetical protein SGILL_003891 [Bacillariaceae sp.]